MSLNVSLPEELEKKVRDHVASGYYGSASEVIREALRLFEAYHTTRQAQLTSLKRDIEEGMADLANDKVSEFDLDDIKQNGRQILGNKIDPA